MHLGSMLQELLGEEEHQPALVREWRDLIWAVQQTPVQVHDAQGRLRERREREGERGRERGRGREMRMRERESQVKERKKEIHIISSVTHDFGEVAVVAVLRGRVHT